jgi:hypothetical protein
MRACVRTRERHPLAQVTVGLQLCGQACSQIVFFQDERPFR